MGRVLNTLNANMTTCALENGWSAIVISLARVEEMRMNVQKKNVLLRGNGNVTEKEASVLQKSLYVLQTVKNGAPFQLTDTTKRTVISAIGKATRVGTRLVFHFALA